MSRRIPCRLLLLAVAAGLCGCRGGAVARPAAFDEGLRLYRAGKYEEARFRFADVLRSSTVARPWGDEALYYRARCEQLAGRPGNARGVFDYLLKAPRHPSLELRGRSARADLCLELGEYERAARDYRRARRLLEADPVGLGRLGIGREKLLFGEGRALLAAGRRSEAARVLGICLDEYPESAELVRHFLIDARLGRPSAVTFYVLVGGLYRVKSAAEGLAARVRERGFEDVSVEKRSSADGFVYVVRVGRLEDRADAHRVREGLLAAGFTRAAVRP
ncbi:MAG: SPOR domain-containing protein [Planctomycetota bacterium]|jgi:tetratricopeptide (TPR) repeat protein